MQDACSGYGAEWFSCSCFRAWSEFLIAPPIIHVIIMERCTIMKDTLAWDLSGSRDETNCIDIDPDMLYELEAIDDPGAA